MELAANACDVFVKKCVVGIKADTERAAYWIEYSLALVTPLARKIGYDKATEVAKKVAEGKSLREVFKELGFSDDEIRKIVDLDKLAKGLY